jgi:hypothetical protein
MRERAEDMLHTHSTPLDNVFELNWQSQSVHAMLKLELPASASTSSSRKHRTSDLNTCVDHASVIFDVLTRTTQRTILRLESLETNYLAVIYECLSNLDAIMTLSGNPHQMSHMHDEIRNQRLRYFAALRRGEYGLYYFKDGKTARLDITEHVMSNI